MNVTAVACALLLALIASGCGAKKTSFSTSRGSVVSGGNSRLGECNRVELNQLGVKGQIGTYYDPVTRNYRSDYINFNVTSVPAELFTSDTLLFQIFRWSERTAGQRQNNTVPVRFFYVDKLTGMKTPTTPIDRISKATLVQAKTAFGSGWFNVSLAQFFERTMIVLTGIEMQYDAITVAMYDSAVSPSVLAQGDILLPPVYANPNVYRSKNPTPNLYTLHPNYAQIDSHASENDYFQMIEDICYELSGVGKRIPASEINESRSWFVVTWQRIVESLDILISYLF